MASHTISVGKLARSAARSMFGLYGFKLQMVIHGYGAMLAFALTSGDVDDRKLVPKLVKASGGR